MNKKYHLVCEVCGASCDFDNATEALQTKKELSNHCPICCSLGSLTYKIGDSYEIQN